MMYNNKQIIRDSIMIAIRNGEKQTTIGDLVVSIDYTPQMQVLRLRSGSTSSNG